MSIAVAGCVAQAEGEEIIRRAPVVDVVVGPQSYHHLPQLLARAEAHGRALETEFPVEDKFAFLPPPKPRSDPRARHFVLRHGAGRLRQVLHLLRRALYARRRGVAAGRQDRRRREAARRQRRARNHPDRTERQRLSRRRTGRPDLAARHPAASPCRNSRHRPPALLDQPSPRRRRQPDRGASRPAGADAVRASAGAIRFRPDSGRHEPQTYRRRLPPRHRPISRRSPRYCIFIGFYRRLPRRDRGRFSGHPRACHTNRIRWRLFVQIFAAAGHAGGGHAGDGVSG